MKEQLNQRIEWVDTVKGLGIILVLIGHCNIPRIYLFHMPLFYIISGFCWNVDKYKLMPFNGVCYQKVPFLYFPYIKIALICFVVFGVFAKFKDFGLSTEYIHQLLKYAFGMLIYSRGTAEWLPNCSPIWFLTALFVAELLFFLINKQKRVLLFVVAAGLIGYLCSFCGKIFPWNIDNALTAIPFLYIGVLLRRHWGVLSQGRYLTISLAASTLFLVYGIKGIDYDGNSISNIWIMGAEAVVIVFSIMSAVFRISEGGGDLFSLMLGKHTVLLLGYNYTFNTIVYLLLPSKAESWTMALIVVVMAFLACWVASRFSFVEKILIR